MHSSADAIPAGVVLERSSLRDVPAAATWLSASERKVADEFGLETRRQSWLLGRWTAKQAVMRLDGSQPSAEIQRWAILAADDGAPEVFRDDVVQPVSISISHRAGRALAVAATHPLVVGCDLELVESRSEPFVDDYFVETEREFVRMVPPGEERDVRANLVWSAKEAALKVLRTGLRRDTRSVVAAIEGGGPGGEWNRLTVVDTLSQETIPGWWRVTEGFTEVLAVGMTGIDR